MALRLVEMACPESSRHEVEELLQEFEPLNLWHDQLMDERTLIKVLLPAENAEAVLDRLESAYGRTEGFRVILTDVQAVVPRPEAQKQEENNRPGEPAGEEKPKGRRWQLQRISRQELETEISASAEITGIYLALTFISSLVAAIGLWRNNTAVIIGAMVIAPLLGPNMAFAFATTLGDGERGRRALAAIAAGVGVAVLVSVALGAALPLQWELPEALGELGGPYYVPELVARTQVGLADIVLALAAGTAGALAFTTGIHTPLVGVMVAVALLPPLVASGLAVGAGRWSMAAAAFLLFFANLICINLAAVGTFAFFGLRPRTWWQADRARKATRVALAMLALLVVALAAAIILARRAA